MLEGCREKRSATSTTAAAPAPTNQVFFDQCAMRVIGDGRVSGDVPRTSANTTRSIRSSNSTAGGTADALSKRPKFFSHGEGELISFIESRTPLRDFVVLPFLEM